MSPCEPLPATKASHSDVSRVLSDDFGVTSNAFLPEQQPLSRLPDQYYAPWETIVSSLSSHIQQQTLRQEVDRLPVLSTDRLASEAEWRRAYVVLGFLTHAYVWGGDVASEVGISLEPAPPYFELTQLTDPPPTHNCPSPLRFQTPLSSPSSHLCRGQPLELFFGISNIRPR